MRRFLRDGQGNVAVLFALAIIPVIGAVGAAVDYSLASAYRSDMQKAIDATALAVSKLMPTDQATLDRAGMDFFNANLGHHNLTNLDLKITPEKGKATLTATADYTPGIASILGVDKFQIGVDATARWGIGKVEVALVLDNSGSMASLSRMTHLKAAAHDLLNVLESSATDPNDAKVAIVPFDSAVRLNYTQTNAPNWIKWGRNGSCSFWLLGSQSACNALFQVWTWSDWSTTKWGSWSGCVEDRDYIAGVVENDVLDTAPDMTTSTSTSAMRTRYPARPCDEDVLRRVTPLTTNWTTLHSEVTAMEPAGKTNIAIGMVWGWHLLSPTALFTEGAAYGTEDLTKFIILMTDGDNTLSRQSNSEATMNARTAAVCTNIKDAGIKIYSVRLIEGNANLIRNCASEPSMYFDVQNASELSSVFKNIASQIASLHLAK